MSDKIQQLINDLSADIIDTYDIHIPIRDVNHPDLDSNES